MFHNILNTNWKKPNNLWPIANRSCSSNSIYFSRKIDDVLKSALTGGGVPPPGLNFTNILRTAFMSKERKNTVKLSVFFALLWSTHVKASSKMSVKLTPGPLGPSPGGGACRFLRRPDWLGGLPYLFRSFTSPFSWKKIFDYRLMLRKILKKLFLSKYSKEIVISFNILFKRLT